MPTTIRKDEVDPAATPQLGSSVTSNNPYEPNVWGSNGLGQVEDLTVPSGQLCQVRRPGLEALIEQGIVNNMDMLTGIVSTEHVDRVKQHGRDLDTVRSTQVETQKLKNEILADSAKFNELLHMVNRVVCTVVVQPPVQMAPNDPTNREKGAVYTDMIELDDKMFIFNYAVGGTRSLEQFRKESESALGSVAVGDEVADEAVEPV